MQWLQKLIKKKSSRQGVVGISFLPHGITIAVADYCENNSVKLIHCEFIETEKTEEYAAILKHWRLIYHLDKYDCHLVLDVNSYQRINIEAPSVPVNEMRLAIRWKVNDLLDFPVEESILDYYPVPTFRDNNPSLEVITSSHSILKPLIEQCLVAGLNLQLIDIQETSLRNLATLLPNSDLGGVAVLYLQQSFGIILIQKKGVIYAARKIAIGYGHLDLDSAPKAEYDRFSLSIDSQAATTQDNLALEIQRSLDYVDNYYDIGLVAELAIIPWARTTETLVNRLNKDYGIYSYLVDLSEIVIHDNMNFDFPIQSLCLPVIGSTLRNTIETTWIAQQVNLYQDSLKPRQRSMAFYAVVVPFLAFVIGFSLINIFLIKNLHNKYDQVEQKRQLLVTEQERVKALETSIPKQEPNPALATEIEQWQKKVESLKQSISILNSLDNAHSQGFSAYFQALANQSVSGVWLSVIHFDAEQQRINFEGSTVKSDRVAYFLQQLQQESIFQGQAFAQLQIEKSAQHPDLMNFKLSTHLDPIEKGKNVH